MRNRWLPALALLLLATAANAQECPTGEPIAKARNVIADRQQIGGIPQWINVRGKHRDNPVILLEPGKTLVTLIEVVRPLAVPAP